MATTADIESQVPVREGDYGSKVTTVEPGGVEYIPDRERHGNPIQLFWTWVSPNMEFATVFVGVLPIAVFGGGFWPTVLGVTIGSLMGFLAGKGMMVEGFIARLMYRSLYKMHEMALHGPWKVAFDTVARALTRRTEPHVKLH